MILNRTIVLVEDSDSDRLLFSKYLKQLGHESICLDSAAKLINRIEEIEPCVILMDIEMPGMTGLEAVKILREHHKFNGGDYVIIALTAHNNDDIIHIAKAAGFDDYLQKPITKRDLNTMLSRYINSESEICLSETEVSSNNGNHKDKLYSLDMFEADDAEFVRSIVEMFVANTAGTIATIKQACEKDEMETVRTQAHKLKPHFTFFGAPNLQQAFQRIEDIAKANKNDEKAILPELIETAEKRSLMMIAQMKADLLS
jgi:CheY-like chemotaxis protein